MTNVSIKWRLTRRILNHVVARLARRVLVNHTLVDIEGHRFRWLHTEIEQFIEALDLEVEALRPMVELTVYTTGADRVLRRMGVAPASARQAIADMGWDVYRRMLALLANRSWSGPVVQNSYVESQKFNDHFDAARARRARLEQRDGLCRRALLLPPRAARC